MTYTRYTRVPNSLLRQFDNKTAQSLILSQIIPKDGKGFKFVNKVIKSSIYDGDCFVKDMTAVVLTCDRIKVPRIVLRLPNQSA